MIDTIKHGFICLCCEGRARYTPEAISPDLQRCMITTVGGTCKDGVDQSTGGVSNCRSHGKDSGFPDRTPTHILPYRTPRCLVPPVNATGRERVLRLKRKMAQHCHARFELSANGEIGGRCKSAQQLTLPQIRRHVEFIVESVARSDRGHGWLSFRVRSCRFRRSG